MDKIIEIKVEKSCGKCTACCSGALQGKVFDKAFWKGRPCHYLVETGCSIYEQRPENPCRKYDCAYIHLDWMPHWMRPDSSGVIVSVKETKKGILYLEVVEYKNKISSEVLSFLFLSHLSGLFQNMMYQLDGAWNKFGSKEFIEDTSGS